MSTENVMMIIIIVLIVIIVVYWLYNSMKIESFAQIDDCYLNCDNIRRVCYNEKPVNYSCNPNSNNCKQACRVKYNDDSDKSKECYNSLYNCIKKSKNEVEVSNCVIDNKQNTCKVIPNKNLADAIALQKSSYDSYLKIYTPCNQACSMVNTDCYMEKQNNQDKNIKECYNKSSVCINLCNKNKLS